VNCELIGTSVYKLENYLLNLSQKSHIVNGWEGAQQSHRTRRHFSFWLKVSIFLMVLNRCGGDFLGDYTEMGVIATEKATSSSLLV
jgi:hypothetical protein